MFLNLFNDADSTSEHTDSKNMISKKTQCYL